MTADQARDMLDEWAQRLDGRRWHVAPNPTPHRARKLDFVALTESHGKTLHVASARSPERATIELAQVVRFMSRT